MAHTQELSHVPQRGESQNSSDDDGRLLICVMQSGEPHIGVLYACALFVVAGIRMLELQAPYSGPLLHDADQAGLFSFPARSTSAPFNCMMFKSVTAWRLWNLWVRAERAFSNPLARQLC